MGRTRAEYHLGPTLKVLGLWARSERSGAKLGCCARPMQFNGIMCKHANLIRRVGRSFINCISAVGRPVLVCTYMSLQCFTYRAEIRMQSAVHFHLQRPDSTFPAAYPYLQAPSTITSSTYSTLLLTYPANDLRLQTYIPLGRGHTSPSRSRSPLCSNEYNIPCAGALAPSTPTPTRLAVRMARMADTGGPGVVLGICP